MIGEHGVVNVGPFDSDGYESSQAADLSLNRAILRADIARGYEDFLAVFEEFYSEDVAVSHEDLPNTIRGKEKVRALLVNFLIPLHIMIEIGGLMVSVRQSAMPGDVPVETHSAWTLALLGTSGATCTLRWRVLRKWLGSRVVYEYHYDHQQSGEPLSFKDLSFNLPDPVTSVQRLS